MKNIDPSVVKAAQEAIDLAAPTGVPQTVADEFLHLIADAVKAAETAALAERDAARAEVARLRAAVAVLLALKDGPRDEDYQRRKPHAWEALRAALAATEDQP